MKYNEDDSFNDNNVIGSPRSPHPLDWLWSYKMFTSQIVGAHRVWYSHILDPEVPYPRDLWYN